MTNFTPFSLTQKVAGWFGWKHQRDDLQPLTQKFHALANDVVELTDADSPDASPSVKAHAQLAINHLWDAKNHAVAALVEANDARK